MLNNFHARESRSLDAPVYIRAATPVTSNGRMTEHSYNVLTAVAGSRVSQGDLVIADESMIAFITHSKAASGMEIGKNGVSAKRS